MDQERGGTDSGEPRGDSGRAEMAHAYLRYLTLIAVTVTIGCILLAAVLSPEFAWRENALSNLGVTWTDAGTTTTAMLFNGGLVTGGTIGVIVTVSGLRWLTRRDDQAVLTLAGAALALMGLVGVFHQGEMLHFPVAISFFLLVSLTLWVDGGLLYRAVVVWWSPPPAPRTSRSGWSGSPPSRTRQRGSRFPNWSVRSCSGAGWPRPRFACSTPENRARFLLALGSYVA